MTVAVSGDYGKPRPALVLQADAFDGHPSVVILPLTTEIHPTPLFRITVLPDGETGLRKVSQVMVDKITAVSRSKIGVHIGHVDASTMETVSRALARFLGLPQGELG